MTTYHTVTNPDIYTDPYSFDPDRWLGPDADRLEKHLTVFSGGARACLGIWLAQAELALTLAKVWRVWDGPEGGRGEEGAGE